MSSRVDQFNMVLIDVIDECLSILGDQPKQAVFQYLATMHSIDREEIPGKLPDFRVGLKKALGGASAVIERLILKKLFIKIGSTFRESQGLDFLDYVGDARRRYEAGKQRSVTEDPLTEHGRSKKGQVSS